MKWEQVPPKEDGIYLRINAGHRIQRHFVKDGLINWGWGGEEGMISIDDPKIKGYESQEQQYNWWWFGPIPNPPKEAM